MPLRISRIHISKILGVDDLVFDCGQVTKFLGSNGAGKTSIIESIKTLYGGLSAKLIMDGADEARTVFFLDNGWQIRNRLRRGKKAEREVLTPDGAVIRSPASWVDARLNPESFEPIRFLNSKPKEQIDQLLKISNLSLRRTELLEAIAGCEVPEVLLLGSDSEMLTQPLSLVEMAYDKIYEQRTGTNAILKQANGHIAVLERHIPANMEVPAEPAEYRDELATLVEKLQWEREAKLKECAEERQDIKDEFGAIEQEAREDRDNIIKAAAAAYDYHMASAREERDKRLEAVKTKAEEYLGKIQNEVDPKIADLNQKMAVAEQDVREYDSWRAKKQDLREAAKERDAHKSKSEAETEALNNLKSLKKKMMQSLPVEGLTIEDGELRYQGHRLETTNTAKKVEIALQVALAGCNPELKLIQLDSLECLDNESQAAVEEWAKVNADVQFFFAGVRQKEYDEDGNMTYDGSLEIETSEASTAVRPA